MIIMGAPSANSIFDQLLGSHTSKVLNHSEVPLLFIPENTSYFPIRRITAGISYQQPGNKSDTWFLNFAQTLNAQIHYVRVVDQKSDEEKLLFQGFKQEITKKEKNVKDHSFKLITGVTADQGTHEIQSPEFCRCGGFEESNRVQLGRLAVTQHIS